MKKRKVSRRVRRAVRKARELFPDVKVVAMPGGKISLRWEEWQDAPPVGSVLAPIGQLRDYLLWERPSA